MSDARGKLAPRIAIAAAIVALLTSVTAVVVVTMRGRGGKPAHGAVATPTDRRIAATDVTKLKRDIVEKVSEGGVVIGVRVTDAEVRTALGLDADDVITAIAGRAIKREFDVYDAVLGMSMMDTSVVYVDLVRDRKPALLRWQLEGDLRSARRADPATGSGGGAGAPSLPYGGIGSSDPLIDTIRKLDELNYEVPRSTIDRLLASSATYLRGARLLPSYSAGRNTGLKLYAIRPSSVFEAAGFQNGDSIREINGNEIGTADDTLELYQRIKDEPVWRISVERRGAPIVITIAIK